MSHYTFPERRSKPRIVVDFPVKMRGTDIKGQKFEVETFVLNLSATGLYLRSFGLVERGEDLFMVIQFLGHENAEAKMARVALKGVVVRVDRLPSGDFGLGVLIKRRRFL